MAPGCRGGPHPHVVPATSTTSAARNPWQATSTTSAAGGNRTGHGVPHTLGPKVDHISLAYYTSIHQSEQRTPVLLKEHIGSGILDTTDCETTRPIPPLLGQDN